MTLYLIIIPVPLAGSLTADLLGNKVGRAGVHTVTVLGVVMSTVLSVYVLWGSIDDNRTKFDESVYTWLTMDGLDPSVGFLVDTMTAMVMAVITGVSLMVYIYTIGYMHDEGAGYQCFLSYISLFISSILMLIMSNNFAQPFFGWEAVGLVSYLLIGFHFERPSVIFANLRALLISRVDDFSSLLGIGLALAYLGGNLRYQDVFAYLPNTQNATIQLFPGVEWSSITVTHLLSFVGVMGRPAQFPLHVWLPDSMEGSAPTSTSIHAATMVTAGLFMVLRMSPIYEISSTTLSVTMVIGAATALSTDFLGMIQNDIRCVVAYSTLSQLGYTTVALGASAHSCLLYVSPSPRDILKR